MQKSVVTVILLLICWSGFAHSFSSFGACFSKTAQDGESTEITSGTIYFQFPTNAIVLVEYPLNQWLKYSTADLLVYYPDDKKAYRMTNERPMAPPFISSFISVIKEDFGLSDLGFKLGATLINGDSIKVEWYPPEGLKKFVSKVQLDYNGIKLISSKTYDIQAQIISANYYSNHVEHRGYFIPMNTVSYTKTETGESKETIVYTQPQFEIDFKQVADKFNLIEQYIRNQAE